jgi:hypothetical protein
MRWAIAAIALVIVANGVVLAAAGRERAGPATFTTIDVCAGHVRGGGASDEPPALRLALAPESLWTPAGLDAPGLRTLGFPDAAIAAVGKERDSTFHRPRARPAWVRLRQRSDSLEQFAVVEVARRRDQLARDSTSILVRGLVSVRERWVAPPPGPGPGQDRAAAGGLRPTGLIHPAVIELIPSQLHLDRGQAAALRVLRADSSACAVRRHAVIANGANGGIWMESVR